MVTSTATLTPARTENVPKVGPQYTPASLTYAVSIAAGAGEPNAVTLEMAPDAILVRDAVAVTPGAGCEAVDALSVRCPTERATTFLAVRRAIAVTLGDGDDRLEAPGAGMAGLAIALEVDAGDGSDVVVADAAEVAGGSGDDRLTAHHATGGGGNDVIHARTADGGAGDDVLGPLPAPGSVSLRGGPGDDVLAGGPTRPPRRT